MTNILILLLAVLIGIPLGDKYYEMKQKWEQYKQEAWGVKE